MKKLCLAVLLIVPVALQAKDKDKGRNHHDDVSVTVKVNAGASAHAFRRFSDNDKKAIVTYFSKHRKGKGLPPGLAKKLSPAQEKTIIINNVLPPDIYSMALPMPPMLLPLLPPPPPGMLLMTISGKAVTVEAKTRVVVDCIDLGF